MSKNIVQEIEILDNENVGIRLDIVSSDLFEITRSSAQKLIRAGEILVNNRLASPKYALKLNDKIKKVLKEVSQKEVVNVRILFEDYDFFVVDKPSGVSVHPSKGDRDITITEIFSDKINDPEAPDRPGVVHRLDKGTSGVLLLAKNTETRKILQSQFKSRKVEKKYLALVEGKLKSPEGVIDIPISRDLQNRNKMKADKNGKSSITEYREVLRYDGYTLVEIKLHTGRTHQIRVHFSAIGHPVVGDVRYGKSDKMIGRIFLHASELKFFHPRSNKTIFCSVELPEELSKILKKL